MPNGSNLKEVKIAVNRQQSFNENYLIPIARRGSAAQTHATLALYDTPSCSAGVCGIPQWNVVSFKQLVVGYATDVGLAAEVHDTDAQRLALGGDHLTDG